MLIIDASSSSKTFSQVVSDHSLIISKEIVEAICDAIDRDVPDVFVCTFIIPGDYGEKLAIDFHMNQGIYRRSLLMNMQTLIDAEEFELCVKARDYANRLNDSVIIEEYV